MEDTANKMTQEKLWTKAYVCLLGVNVLSAFSFYMTATVLISFLTDDAVGMTAAMAGVISAVFSITSFICRPMCGVMSDRMNKVRLLQIAAVMMSLGCFGYTLPAGIGIIILMRVIHGAGFAVNSTAVTALTAEKIPMSKMGGRDRLYGAC